jgi:hypothetical protein
MRFCIGRWGEDGGAAVAGRLGLHHSKQFDLRQPGCSEVSSNQGRLDEHELRPNSIDWCSGSDERVHPRQD